MQCRLLKNEKAPDEHQSKMESVNGYRALMLNISECWSRCLLHQLWMSKLMSVKLLCTFICLSSSHPFLVEVVDCCIEKCTFSHVIFDMEKLTLFITSCRSRVDVWLKALLLFVVTCRLSESFKKLWMCVCEGGERETHHVLFWLETT